MVLFILKLEKKDLEKKFKDLENILKNLIIKNQNHEYLSHWY